MNQNTYQFTLEDIYGISIEDYLVAQKTTIDKLIQKTTIDLKLLKEHLKKLVLNNNEGGDSSIEYLILTITELIKKKERHLTNLEKYSTKNKEN